MLLHLPLIPTKQEVLSRNRREREEKKRMLIQRQGQTSCLEYVATALPIEAETIPTDLPF